MPDFFLQKKTSNYHLLKKIIIFASCKIELITKTNIMKKFKYSFMSLALTAALMFAGFNAMAQKNIYLQRNAVQKCNEANDMGLKASFSFDRIHAENVTNEEGTFTLLTIDNTYNVGEVGAPSLPSVHKLIAVPYGVSEIKAKVTSSTLVEYRLEDYDINNPLMPQQLSVRKDQTEVEFAYDRAVYQTRECVDRQLVMVNILGTMRGIQVAELEINPIIYSPCENKIKVYNDIEVSVSFGDYDKAAADNKFAETFSPYFSSIYDQMFNSSCLRDSYTDNPDLWQFPVKMLVIANRSYETALQPWVEWKIMKGFYMDIHYTDESAVGTTATSIKSFINSKYQSDAPTFVVTVGDVGQIPPSLTTSQTAYSSQSSYGNPVSDLSYYSMDSDYFPEMLYSRMSVENATQLTSAINKILMYEKYTFPDDSYLNNVLLIAGSDGTWNPKVGQPTINYAADNYFNAAHGMTNVYKYLSTYTGCYNNLNTGVGFANYTAHGDNQEWSGPQFTVSNANALTNANKPYIAMGNCCLAANFNYSGGPCLAEALLRGDNKGVASYIGSSPLTYWYEDYYFGVGCTNTFNTTPAMSNTTTGFYDTYWQDETYNTMSALLMFGNLSVTNAHTAGGYTTSASPLYYWQAYHVIGDGSLMPYNHVPADNNVSYAPVIFIGQAEFTVNADPGSYVCISYNNTIYGTATVPASGIAVIELDPFTDVCNANIVVTRQQRKPHIATVEVVPAEGPFITVASYDPNFAHVGEATPLNLVMKNVGVETLEGTTTVTLSCPSGNITFGNPTGTFSNLAADASVNVNGFNFTIDPSVNDGTIIPIIVTSTNGQDSWESTITVTAGKAIFEFDSYSWKGSFTPGETFNVTAKFKNIGHYQSTNAVITASSSNSNITFANPQVEYGTVAPDGFATALFTVTISSSCPATEVIPIDFVITDSEENSADGEGVLSNTCNVVFDLADSYGDGWNGCSLSVSFSDGTPQQSLTISSGSSAQYVLSITTGTTVTVRFISGSYAYETSYEVYYEGESSNPIHTDGTGGTTPSTTAWSFTVNCAGEISEDLLPVLNLTATVESGNNVVLTWEAPTRASLIGYTIYRTDISEPLGTTQETTFTDEGLSEGTYFYIVEANYEEGDVMSNPVRAEITDDGISENSANVTLFPNPAKETLFISGSQLTEVRVYNLYGQEVASANAENDFVEINVSKLAAGVYVVKTDSKLGSNIQRVVVK